MSQAVHGLDLGALTAYLDRERPGLLAGPLTGNLIAGGRSNLTYLVSDGSGSWVVRRPPLGHVLETAHDMAREYRVMARLHGSAVPVPEMVALCEDTGADRRPLLRDVLRGGHCLALRGGARRGERTRGGGRR